MTGGPKRSIGRCGFFLGLSMSLLAASAPVEVKEPPLVTLCDLGRSPDEYNGTFVRTRVDIRGRKKFIWVHDVDQQEPCSSYIMVLLAFPADVKPQPSFSAEEGDGLRNLQQALRTSGQIEATIEARFDSVVTRRNGKLEWTGKGFGKKNLAEGRLVLRRVSEVVVRPLPRK